MEPAVIEFRFKVSNPEISLVKGKHVEHTFPWHVHDSFTLGFVQQGQREVKVLGEQHLISTNECFILNANQPHAISTVGKGGHDYCVISISPTLMHRVFREVTGKDGFPHFLQVKVTDSLIISTLLNWFENESKAEEINEEQFSTLLHQLVLRYAVDAASVDKVSSKHPVVTAAQAYIEANMARVVHLAELADVLQVSPFYLNRIFREEVGIPPYAFLLQIRIKKSIGLLQHSGSVAETAYTLGFADQGHFTRFFKRSIGLTPKRFLDLNQG